MIDEVIRFSNDIVLVFDEHGEQVPEFQGYYPQVKIKVLAHAPRGTQFLHMDWPKTFRVTSRGRW